MFEPLHETAEPEEIRFTVASAGHGTDADADSIHLSRAGIRSARVSVPLRYMHSRGELADVANAARLIAAFALRLGEPCVIRRRRATYIRVTVIAVLVELVPLMVPVLPIAPLHGIEPLAVMEVIAPVPVRFKVAMLGDEAVDLARQVAPIEGSLSLNATPTTFVDIAVMFGRVPPKPR